MTDDRREYMRLYMQRRRATQRAERLAAGDGDDTGDVAPPSPGLAQCAGYDGTEDKLGRFVLIGVGVLALAIIARAFWLTRQPEGKADIQKSEC